MNLKVGFFLQLATICLNMILRNLLPEVTGMEMFWIFLFGLILVTCSNITNPYPLKRFYYMYHNHETIAWMSMATKLLELWHGIWRFHWRCSKKLEFYERQFQPTRKIQNLRRVIWKYQKWVSDTWEFLGVVGGNDLQNLNRSWLRLVVHY